MARHEKSRKIWVVMQGGKLILGGPRRFTPLSYNLGHDPYDHSTQIGKLMCINRTNFVTPSPPAIHAEWSIITRIRALY